MNIYINVIIVIILKCLLRKLLIKSKVHILVCFYHLQHR